MACLLTERQQKADSELAPCSYHMELFVRNLTPNLLLTKKRWGGRIKKQRDSTAFRKYL